ncbi:hypothetical protein PM082_022548 [Marasmius tenuissimus]|nr:hypothetical protein PM082_022548 [Marasmius tenuissimus]
MSATTCNAEPVASAALAAVLPSSTSHLVASCLFSFLVIKNLVSSTAEPLPLSLQRKETFPAPRFIPDFPHWPNSPPDYPPGWFIDTPKPHPNTLVVELEEKLGAAPKPTHVCIKFAMPYHCRSLAREAWFYDQLPEEQGFQGCIVPKCYGLFTSSLGDATTIVPWEKNDVDVSLEAPEDYDEEEDPHADFLPEDRRDPRALSPNAEYTSSSWHDWSPDPKNPLVSVLVLEKLGRTLDYEQEQNRNSPVAVKNMSDLKELMTDLTAAHIIHADVRMYNFLHAFESSSSTGICPRHGHPHKYRIIDFDRSLKTDENVIQWSSPWRLRNAAMLRYPKFWCDIEDSY